MIPASRRQLVAWGALLATIMAVISTAGHSLAALAYGEPIGVGRALAWGFIDWSVWVSLVPIALAIVRRWPLDQGRVIVPLAAHVGGALATMILWAAVLALFCVLLELVCNRLGIPFSDVLPAGSDPTRTPFGRFEGIISSRGAQNVTIFGVVIAIAYATRAAARHRAEEQRLASELARRAGDELSAMQRQVNVELLADALETIAERAVTHPERAEAAALSLARLMRTATGRQSPLVPLRQELAVADSYLELLAVNGGGCRATLDTASVRPELADIAVPTFAIPAAIRATGVGDDARVRIEAQRAGGALVLDISGGNGARSRPDSLDSLRDRWRKLFGEPGDVHFYARAGTPTVRLRVPIS